MNNIPESTVAELIYLYVQGFLIGRANRKEEGCGFKRVTGAYTTQLEKLEKRCLVITPPRSLMLRSRALSP